MKEEEEEERRLRPTERLPSVKEEVPHNNHNLTQQSPPERSTRHRGPFDPISERPVTRIREHRSRPDPVGSGLSRDHDGCRTDDLGEGECRADVETGEGLEEDHAESDALDGVEHAEPEPEGRAEVRADGACPGDVNWSSINMR